MSAPDKVAQGPAAARDGAAGHDDAVHEDARDDSANHVAARLDGAANAADRPDAAIPPDVANQPGTWGRRPLARATAWYSVPVGAMFLLAAAPPGTFVPLALFALFFALLLLPLWLYAALSALARGVRGLSGRLPALLVYPGMLALSTVALLSHTYDRWAFVVVRPAMTSFEQDLASLPADRHQPDTEWAGPYPVRAMRIWGADRGLVQIELSMTRTFLGSAGLVLAEDQSSLDQLQRIDPTLQLWPLAPPWHAYSGDSMDPRR
ncbi:MAG: hypothetical protein GC161_07165 [Planctomycetaceae bacterium]|nr:hypothetical protein [Planctomycetaceae bacterium]